MHRCFIIPEIVLEICQHLAYEPPWYVGQREAANSRRALARLARTCSLFQRPATEKLWSRIGPSHGLDPLLDALPEDLWHYDVVLGKRDKSSRVRISVIPDVFDATQLDFSD
jgi:hypothetical protein